MFKIKTADGLNNLCGRNLKAIREDKGYSQRSLAGKLQLNNVDMDHFAIRRIENGERFVTDIELVALAEVLDVDIIDLVKK